MKSIRLKLGQVFNKTVDPTLAALEVLVPLVKVIPVLGSPVEAALEAGKAILKYSKEVQANKVEAQKLGEDAAKWINNLVTTLQSFGSDVVRLQGLHDQVEELLNVLKRIEKSMEERAKQSLRHRIVHQLSDADEITRFHKELTLAYKSFMLASQLHVQNDISRLDAAVSYVTDTTDRGDQKLDTLIVAAVQGYIRVDNLISQVDRETLDSLNPVRAARYDSTSSPQGCFKDTRADVFRKLLAWVLEPSESISIYWLTGMAGTGKSTIAKSFCERVLELSSGGLLTTFFASKSSAERRDLHRMISTLVYDVASRCTPFQAHVIKEIRSPQGISHRPMKELIERLLAGPINASGAITQNSPLIIVIDALDECAKVDGLEGGTLVQDLAAALKNQPVKILITSRMEDSIQSMFDSLPKNVLKLHEIEDVHVADDVRRILTQGFGDISINHRIPRHTWPSMEDIEALVSQTGHLMIFATTVMKFIGEKRYDPRDRLRRVLSRKEDTSNKSPFTQVDALYVDILINASRDENGDLDVTLQNRLRDLISTICLVREPLSTMALAALLSVPDAQVNADVRALASVLKWGTGESDHDLASVQVFHPSFREFIMDRCSELSYSVDIPQFQGRLSVRCLEMLNENLHQDMCHIRNPSNSNTQVNDPDLKHRLKTYVTEALTYAPLYWLVHATSCGAPTSAFLKALTDFASEHLLHWTEILSLLDRLPHALTTMPQFLLWLQESKNVPGPSGVIYREAETGHLDQAYALLKDVLAVIQVYDPVLKTHALHAYHSLHVTMPECSLLRINLDHCQTGSARLISARARTWSSTPLVMRGHSGTVLCVAFSPDGQTVASGSHDKTVRIWDAKSGRETGVFMGHGGTVFAVAYSPDSRRIASASEDKTVRIWDRHSSQEIAVFKAHDITVCSVAFSSDGRRVVSGSHDMTVRIWDALSARETSVLQGHRSIVSSVAFSPDGHTVVSGSHDKTVRLWDADFRREIAIFDSHDGSVSSVAFSPDGCRVASGSYDNTVRIWDIASGLEVAVLKNHTNPVSSVAFSPDGESIASGSYDSTVRVWDMQSYHEIAMLKGLSHWVTSIAFAPDGNRILSGSDDKLVQIRDARADQGHTVLKGHDSMVASLVFSPDGSRIASGSIDRTVRVWDANSGCELAVFEGHRFPVTSLAFSLDGRLVKSTSDWGEARIWDIETLLPLTHDMTFSPASTSTSLSSPIMHMLKWDQSSGWISQQSAYGGPMRLCWLPEHLRGHLTATHGTIMVIGGQSGTVTILDLSEAVHFHSNIDIENSTSAV